jgi:flagellar biosynthesis/type III secretory pathway protein FliH
MPSAPHSILAPALIHIGEDNNNIGYGSRYYKIGFQAGAQNGDEKGYNAGLEDCFKHGRQGILTKFDNPEVNDKWSGNYQKGYLDGFKKGYLKGYRDARFECLKK